MTEINGGVVPRIAPVVSVERRVDDVVDDDDEDEIAVNWEGGRASDGACVKELDVSEFDTWSLESLRILGPELSGGGRGGDGGRRVY